jgi:hypothetical protein
MTRAGRAGRAPIAAVLCAMALAVLAACMKSPQPDILFGNTLHVQKGILTLDFYYDPDGTFTNSAGRSGTWTYDGHELCVDYANGGGSHACTQFSKDHHVGDSWTQHDPDGPVLLTLLGGRQAH